MFLLCLVSSKTMKRSYSSSKQILCIMNGWKQCYKILNSDWNFFLVILCIKDQDLLANTFFARMHIRMYYSPSSLSKKKALFMLGSKGTARSSGHPWNSWTWAVLVRCFSNGNCCLVNFFLSDLIMAYNESGWTQRGTYKWGWKKKVHNEINEII